MKSSVFYASLVILAVVLAACGPNAPAIPGAPGSGSSGPKVTSLADVPAFEGATQLQPGQNPMADTLAKNVQQSAGLGQKLDQRIYSIPKSTNWDAVKKFYGDKMTASGWQPLNANIPDNDMFKLAIWRNGTQSLTVAHLTDPTSKDTFVLLSMAN